jgi:GntR family transcriptional regulator
MTTPASTKIEISARDPLYKQVEQHILQCLESGEWKPGEQLPTESQLAERFGVAVFTLRAGISELVATGILARKQGKGTFVARHNRQRQRYQFSHAFRRDGQQVFADRRLLSISKATAPQDVAEALRLGKEDRGGVLQLACLLTEAGEPAATLDIFLPSRKFQGLTEKAINASNENLYAVYQDACGINVISIEERVLAVPAKPAIARSLKVPQNSPLLRIERIAYTYNAAPVEYRVRHFDGGKYDYRVSEGGV